VTADDLLLAPYRPVRRVGAPADGPWPGMLVRLESGQSLVLVDADALGSEWAGWDAAPDGHVLAALDVVRRSDGHDAALPLCVERVADFVARRAAAGVPLAVGETITLAVSLLRGMGEVGGGDARRDARPHAVECGEWWLTESGRPVLATGVGDDAREGTMALLRALSADRACAEALADAESVLATDRRSPRDLGRAEESLFACADPLPLATNVLAPRAARDVSAAGRAGAPVLEEREPRPALIDGIARFVDADFADVVSRATTALWRRARAPRSGGRKPIIAAAAVAAVVIAGGMLWPVGGGPATADIPDTPDTADPGAPSASAVLPHDAPPDAPDIQEDGAVTPVDLAAVADLLLAGRLACEDDADCLASVMADPGAGYPSGVIDLVGDERRTTVLDDFGGVAVLRVDAVDAAVESQLVVIMLREEGWLLRDVHVAKQP